MSDWWLLIIYTDTLRSTSAASGVDPTEAICQNFVIVGGVLGSLLVAASVMMCILSLRLYKLTKKFRRDKLDSMVSKHRQKFGIVDRCQSPALFASRRQENPLRSYGGGQAAAGRSNTSSGIGGSSTTSS